MDNGTGIVKLQRANYVFVRCSPDREILATWLCVWESIHEFSFPRELWFANRGRLRTLKSGTRKKTWRGKIGGWIAPNETGQSAPIQIRDPSIKLQIDRRLIVNWKLPRELV